MFKLTSFLFMLIVLLLVINGRVIAAEDAYHMQLRTQLDDVYDITGGTWLLQDNDATNANNWSGSGLNGVVPIAGQPFEQYLDTDCTETQPNPWNVGVRVGTSNTMNEGDVMLLTFWARASSFELSSATIEAIVEDTTTYNKSLAQPVTVEINWAQYFLPFEAVQLHPAGNTNVQFNLGTQAQEVEIAGINALNFGNAYTLEELQDKFLTYQGHDPDAPWRTDAADRIDQYRKAPLTVYVEDQVGTPIPMADVMVEMQRHEFVFGTAVKSRWIADDDPMYDTYREKLVDLDGNGHGFNGGTPENALKWRGWECIPCSATPTEAVESIVWMKSRGMEVRGHNVLWGGWQYSPDDLEANQHDPVYIETRITDRIDDVMTYPGVLGELVDWDVVNESVTNSDFVEVFAGLPGYVTGEEKYVEWFNAARSADPNAKLYWNDYNILSSGGSNVAHQNKFHQLITDLLANGGALDGIGLQAHMKTSLTPPERLYEILEDYAVYGKEIRITEYDQVGLQGDLSADYMRDFMTMIFSHPSVTGFYMWGFVDHGHWGDDAPIFDDTWTLKPSGQAFVDLVFDEWWSTAMGQTAGDGNYVVPDDVFKGTYVIKASYDGVTETVTTTISADTTLTLTLPTTISPTAVSVSGGSSTTPLIVYWWVALIPALIGLVWLVQKRIRV